MAIPPFRLRREQWRAAALLGVPLVLASLLWIVALVTADREPSEGSVALSTGQQDQGEDAGPSAGESPRERDRERSATTGASDDEEPAADATGESGTIEFDGVCEVEVDGERQAADLRAWHFAECERAPLAVPASGTRWIVVVASLSGEDFTEREAVARLDAEGAADHLLWSSHYRSLNPGLWVLAAGPYATEAEAVREADRLGGGAYARELSDDADDRYCRAADGCTGETRGAERDGGD